MVKQHANLNIEHDVIEKAKEKRINISQVAEKALREHLKIEEVHIEEAKECDFCRREGVKETIETLNQNDNGLTWLYPDEKWICNSCLRRKGRNIVKR